MIQGMGTVQGKGKDIVFDGKHDYFSTLCSSMRLSSIRTLAAGSGLDFLKAW